MRVLRTAVSGAALVILAACSTLASDGKRIDYGASATQVPSLELPPDLTAPAADDRYKVPQGAGEATTYSDYSKGSTQSRPSILPEVQGVHMERNGAERWLVIDEKPEIVWPIVKTFWLDLGLTISNEDQAAGVIETNWALNRARTSKRGPSIGPDEQYTDAYESSERDQYITRLERGKDGASTEVHIIHRGLRETNAAGQGAPQWVARPEDPELEAIMLQRLMQRFGVSEVNAAKAVAAASPPPAGAAAAAADTAAEPTGTASLRELSGGNTIIVMNDPFDRSWRKVGLAIDGAGLAVEDKDREKGIYYLSPVKLERSWFDKLEFWKSGIDPRRYRVQVKDRGTSCEVFIVDQDGLSNKVGKQMLEAIYKNLGKQ